MVCYLACIISHHYYDILLYYCILYFVVAPTIKADSAASITVQEGDNITLICEANGIPAPNITWKRGDGFPLPGGGFQHRVYYPMHVVIHIAEKQF